MSQQFGITKIDYGKLEKQWLFRYLYGGIPPSDGYGIFKGGKLLDRTVFSNPIPVHNGETIELTYTFKINNEEEDMTQQQPGAVQPMNKPSWKGLQGGGTTPVGEFVGTVGSWGLVQGNFGQQVVFKIHQVQVLQTDTPFPYAELDLSIKYSGSENSGWGKFGESVARVFGISMEVLDIDQMIGQVIHCVRHDNFTFFVAKDGGAAIGSYWELVQIVQPGTTVPSIFATTNAGEALGAATNPNGTPTLPIAPPVAATPVAPPMASPIPAPAVPIPVPVPVPVPVIPASPDGGQAETVALGLLHGKTLSEFYRDTMQNPEIRANPTISQSIVSQTYVESLKQQGKVTLNVDGTHSVVGM